MATTIPKVGAPTVDPQEEELAGLLKTQLRLQSLYFEKLKLYEEQHKEIEKQEEISKQQQLVSKLYQNLSQSEFSGTFLPHVELTDDLDASHERHMERAANDQWTRLQYMYRWSELFPDDDSWYKKAKPKRVSHQKNSR
jgi:hypothetical protein